MNARIFWTGIVLLMIFFVGCAQLQTKDCEADLKCLAAAVENNCSSAKIRYNWNSLENSFSSTLTISRQNTSCMVDYQVQMNGNKFGSGAEQVSLPAKQCRSLAEGHDISIGYIGPDGHCKCISAFPGIPAQVGNC